MSAIAVVGVLLVVLLIVGLVLWALSRPGPSSVYGLRYGRGYRYYGVTNNPQAREAQHRRTKRFHRLELLSGPISSRREAEELESAVIEQHAVRRGRPPHYNKRKTRW